MLQASIQDYRDNITRFLLVARDPRRSALPTRRQSCSRCRMRRVRSSRRSASSRCATSISTSSNPVRCAGGARYLFYVDLAAGRSDVRCGRAIVYLSESARWVKILGSYARWNEASMKTLLPEASVDVSAV